MVLLFLRITHSLACFLADPQKPLNKTLGKSGGNVGKRQQNNGKLLFPS